ncbi:MFS transporter (plasmid) [Chloroflexota bacterium]|nr:MFS transporter [Chloroflexota bacterium]
MHYSNAAIQSERRNERLKFGTYGVSFISLGLALAALGPMLPSLAENLGVTIGKISFVLTVSNLGYLIGSAGGGRLYDRLKGHRLMSLALILMIVSAILAPLMTNFYLLLLVFLIFGFGNGLVDVGGNVNLLWVFQSRVGPYMNALHFFFGVGAFLAPIILNYVMTLTNGAITWPFWILAILFLPGLLGLNILPSPENPEAGEETESAQKPDTGLVILIMALFFLYISVEAGYGSWVFTYVTRLGIANDTVASYINSAYWGALTLGRLIAIPLSRKIKPGTLLVGNYVLAIIILVMWMIWPVSPWMLWIGSAGLGLALASVFPTLLALGETRMKVTGAVTGLFFFGSSLGGTIIPTLLGLIFDKVGSYHMILTLFGLACAGFAVLVLTLLASKRVGEKKRI